MRLILQLFVSVCLLANLTSATASEFSRGELDARATITDIFAGSILTRAKIAMIGVEEILKSQTLTEAEAHKIMRRVVDKSGSFRALLFIGADGVLKFDSNAYPNKKYLLKQRQYFTSAVGSDVEHFVLGGLVRGKSSGTVFLPLAKRVEKNGVLFGVLVAVVSPDKLVNTANGHDCTECVMIILDADGETIAKYPTELNMTAIKNELFKNPLAGRGHARIFVGDLSARLNWVRNQEYPIISVFLKFDRN